MKKICLFMFVAFMAMATQAQITWNAKAGLGFAKCIAEDGYETGNAFVGKIGVGIEKPFTANWSIMPSLELAMKGAKFDDDNSSGGASSSELRIYYVQVPVLAAYRFNLNESWNITLKAGPYFAFGIKGDDEGEDIFDDDGGGKRFDLGIDLGFDFEYQRYVFGFEYEYGLTSIYKHGDVKTSAVYVTVGYKF